MIKNMTGKFAFFLIVPMFFCSCTDFFSTTLAPWAARDPDTLVPAVTTGNVQELIELAEDDPDLSLVVLKKIRDAADKANKDDKAVLLAASLEAAANASGLGPALLGNAGNILDALNQSDNAIAVAMDALNDMKNLEEVSDILTEILIPGTPEFDAFLELASPDDLAVAAALILAAEAKNKIDSEDYLNSFDGEGELSANEELAIELAKNAVQKAGLNDHLSDFLIGLGLVNDSGTPEEPQEPVVP